MRVYLFIIFFGMSSIQLLAQNSGIEFSFTNSFFDTSNGAETIVCDDPNFCSILTGISLEVEFKFTLDYSHRITDNIELLGGGGLNIWAYELFDYVNNPAISPTIDNSDNNEQTTASLLQLNFGIRNKIFKLNKYTFYIQNKIIFGLGDAFGYEYRHLGLQPALGFERLLNKKHNLFFAVNYTKYFSKAFEGKELPNPQSFGLSVGIAKQL